jgi:homoserine O-succinyltransferase
VPSLLLSCLSAHAALLSFDQLNRRLLLEKCSGVFDHTVDGDHPLMAGIDAIPLPHSRFNEVGQDEVVDAGYQVVARSAEAGWAVAVGERGQCEVSMFQGHPEYAAHTLLREYRRDVRRFLSGSQGSYPHIPTGYLEADGVEALVEFHAEAATLRDPRLMEHFPYELAARHVCSGWHDAAQLLMGNWLRSVRRRAGAQPAEASTLAKPGQP